jgi:hypothetical protein
MIRLIASVAAFAAIASTAMTASAYTPKPIPCPKCGMQVKSADRVVNPGATRGIIIVGGRFNRVALNPQPLPPKFLGYRR